MLENSRHNYVHSSGLYRDGLYRDGLYSHGLYRYVPEPRPCSRIRAITIYIVMAYTVMACDVTACMVTYLSLGLARELAQHDEELGARDALR